MTICSSEHHIASTIGFTVIGLSQNSSFNSWTVKADRTNCSRLDCAVFYVPANTV